MLLCRVTKFPFFQLPTPFVKRNNTSARENQDFLSQAVRDLLRLDFVEELACKPDIIDPLSVYIRSSGKQRLILDLRHVNQFIYKQRFASGLCFVVTVCTGTVS